MKSKDTYQILTKIAADIPWMPLSVSGKRSAALRMTLWRRRYICYSGIHIRWLQKCKRIIRSGM